MPVISSRVCMLAALIAVSVACGRTSAPPIDIVDGDAGLPFAADAGLEAADDASRGSRPRSCEAENDGAAYDCGASQGDDCCASPVVPSGSFYRGNVAGHSSLTTYPASVNALRLDRYEITVGRFREFVIAYPTSMPVAGAGAHPLIPGSGWQAGWPLPADGAALRSALAEQSGACSPAQGQRAPTWTDVPGANEDMPINCLTWYEAFAFCAWDGGRLPTRAELGYALAGGDEQRAYPWSVPASSLAIDGTFAVYADSSENLGGPDRVGSRSKGDGRWGQRDLAGNLSEMVLDTAVELAPGACENCADLSPGPAVVTLGGSWGQTAAALVTNQSVGAINRTQRALDVGARCARAL